MVLAATLDNTLGAMQIGATLAMFLFGILTLQVETYFHLFADDHIGLKAIVSKLLRGSHRLGLMTEHLT